MCWTVLGTLLLIPGWFDRVDGYILYPTCSVLALAMNGDGPRKMAEKRAPDEDCKIECSPQLALPWG